MKSLICIISTLLALANASGYFYAKPETLLSYQLNAATLQSPIQQQYYTQDAFGQYSYGYSEPLSTKQEIRTLDGVTRGSYSYVDANGKLQTVDYTADAGGFRVAATNLPRPVTASDSVLPQPVMETAEVAAARAQHLAAHKLAKLRLSETPLKLTAPHDVSNNAIDTSSLGALPQPVKDTPEVAAAKREFFNRYEQEKLRHELLHKKQATAYTILKTHPIVAAVPVTNYQAVTLPSSNFGYNYKVVIPNVQRTYLPVA